MEAGCERLFHVVGGSPDRRRARNGVFRRRRARGEGGAGTGPRAAANRRTPPLRALRLREERAGEIQLLIAFGVMSLEIRDGSRYAPELESLWLAVIVRSTLMLTPPFTMRYLSESEAAPIRRTQVTKDVDEQNAYD